MSRGQILHAALILKRLISYESKALAQNSSGFEPIVTEENLGTLLLCALAIAGKINEDHPFNNRYWANLLQIDVKIVNSSEALFLQRVHYEVSFNSDAVLRLGKSLQL